MSISSINATSARARADDFATTYLEAFTSWRLHDDVFMPGGKRGASASEKQLAIWAYQGARATALRDCPKSPAQAAIAALIAYDEIETLIANHGEDAPSEPLTEREMGAMRLIFQSLREIWRYLDANGGSAARPFADYMGLKSSDAEHA